MVSDKMFRYSYAATTLGKISEYSSWRTILFSSTKIFHMIGDIAYKNLEILNPSQATFNQDLPSVKPLIAIHTQKK